ncbi:MAG: hypothetical protein RMK20_07895, partial [Verrucomicrobiales bacterium]|nr:hypothetical protein [Verrucomicrobiales bacterium]
PIGARRRLMSITKRLRDRQTASLRTKLRVPTYVKFSSWLSQPRRPRTPEVPWLRFLDPIELCGEGAAADATVRGASRLRNVGAMES